MHRHSRNGEQCMIARVVVFFALVAAVAGATFGMGQLVEPATACQAYKTC